MTIIQLAFVLVELIVRNCTMIFKSLRNVNTLI